jgi:hypothetical protein
MAHITTLHLKVDADSTTAVELAPRVKGAILDGLGAALAEGGKLLDWDALAATATRSVMAEILRVRQATPAEAAIARVRALHQSVYEACGWCSTNDRYQEWPCPTIRALGGEQPDA